MTDKLSDEQNVIEAYQEQAKRYNLSVRMFDIFAKFGFDISGWREKTIAALNLKQGDTVVDIGCGTGLNFPLLYEAVGPAGTIIGVDLSESMLEQAKQTVESNQWQNVQLVCADAARYEFPAEVDAIVTAYTLILVPDAARVVANAHAALVPGGRLAVLDMAWPKFCPLWWRYVLFFLRSYGVTADVLRRRSWEAVQNSMKTQFADFSLKHYWFGFFYLASGTAGNQE